ncbi:unnamed protein product, partial [Didymodactylos carnosus]
YFQKELPSKHETDHDLLFSKAFAIKYNAKKMKKLEKDYATIRKEEQEEQIEIRRLKTENKLLRQRVENLEKESANLADRLIQGQVTNAQSAEELYQLKRDNCNLKKQYEEIKQNPIISHSQSFPLSISPTNSSNDLIRPLNQVYRREYIETRIFHQKYQQSDFLTLSSSSTPNPSKLDQLEEQLKYYRSKESEMNIEVKSLRESMKKLNDENRRLQETPQIEIASLQEELTLVKMRDAEATVNLNELKQRVVDLNREWQIHEQKCKILLSDKQQQILTPQEYDVVEHELLTLKMREAQTDCENKLLSQKIMDIETQKQVAYNQIKRQDEEIQRIKLELQQSQTKENELRTQMIDVRYQMRDLEIKQKEDSMMIKIRDAESTQMIGDLRQKIAELEVKNQELVTADQLSDDKDLQEKLAELQEEIMNLRFKNGSSSALYRRYSMSNYQNDYEDSGDEDQDDLYSSVGISNTSHSNLILPSILSPKHLRSSSLKSSASIPSLKTNGTRLPTQSNLDKTKRTSSCVLDVKSDSFHIRSPSAYQDDFNRNSDLDDSATSIADCKTNNIVLS